MTTGLSESALIGGILVGFVVVQRLVELVIANRNTRKLLSGGGQEHGKGHYPFFILLHGTWLIACAVAAVQAEAILWPAVIAFLFLQAGRVWVIATLGRYWTTRIITVRDAPLIASGPFRFVRHPNYIVVIGEIAALPIAFGAYEIAAVYSLANAVLLFHRIRIENAVLAPRRTQTG